MSDSTPPDVAAALADAEKAEALAGREPVHPMPSRREARGMLADIAPSLAAHVRALLAENERLRKAIIDFGSNPAGFDWGVLGRINELEADRDRLAAENAALRAALKPFAEYDYADVELRGIPRADELPIGRGHNSPTYGDCRRAAALLGGGGES